MTPDLELDEWGYVVPVKPKWFDHWALQIDPNPPPDAVEAARAEWDEANP